MGRPKTQVKLKEPIKIRLKKLTDGHQSIYLDIYWKGVRKYEYLKLYLVPEVNPLCKEQNRKTMAIAERIKIERIKALQNYGVNDWDTVKQGSMLLTRWLQKYCEGGVGIKKSTLHCRVEMLHTVEKYIQESKKFFITLEEVNADFCRGYVKFLRNFPNSHIIHGEPRPISQNTANRYLGMFSTALNKAAKLGVIKSNPMNDLDAKERIQPKDGTKEYLTIDELKALMATDCYRPEVKQAFIFACLTGLRFSDIRALRWTDIKMNGGSPMLLVTQKKTNIFNAIPICSTAMSWMPPKGKDDMVFHLAAHANVDAALKRIAKKVGIEKNISFHTSRHTFGMMVQATTHDIETTKKLMGHKSLKSTVVYADVLTEEKVKAIGNTATVFNSQIPHVENTKILKTKRTAATNTHPRRFTVTPR